MFAWFRRQSTSPIRRTRLDLEALEGRDCPAAPVITSFTVTDMGANLVALTGTVQDESPDTTIVAFGNAAGSIGSTYAGSGSFSLTAPVSQLGQITAVAVDEESLWSDEAFAQLASNVPTISITSIAQGASGTVTISGQVVDEFRGGLAVTLGGVVDAEVYTDEAGAFSVTTFAYELGAITASVSDVWGQAATPASSSLTNTAPTITGFTAIHISGNIWEFRGRVTDEYAPGLTVRLSGLASMGDGVDVTVDGSGYFTYQMECTPQDAGTVYANVTDWWSAAAQEVSFYFAP